MPKVTLETHAAVRIVRLSRPEKKNALDVEMYEALEHALRDAREDSSIRVIVLTGSEGMFTAGNDIADFMSQPPTDENSAVFRFLKALMSCPKPIVAAVDGIAVGVGTTMLLHCDLVVASERARFRLPFVNLGLVPEAASSVLLPRIAGMQRALEWFLLGDFFDARQAKEAGLVNAVVPPESLDATALGYAQAIAAKPPEAVRLTKQLVRGPLEEEVSSASTREARLFFERLRSPEAMEAFGAFMKK